MTIVSVLRRGIYIALFLALCGTAQARDAGSVSVGTVEAGKTASFIDEDPEECYEFAPQAYDTSPTYSKRLHFRVYVLLNGISVERGEQVMATVAKTYDVLNIGVESAFEEVSFTTDTTNEPPWGNGEPAHRSANLFKQAKEHVGGKPPEGFDIVYVMSATDIRGSTGGVADCIGGIRYPARSFAVGEAAGDDSEEWGWFAAKQTEKIATHEIGHLLGAHHQYANCAEADKLALVWEMGACTIMFPEGGFVSLSFSTIEARVIRGHVEAFAGN